MKPTKHFFLSCKESRIETPTRYYGCFYLGPFKASQSLTLANALRRTLLSEIRGLAITSIYIEGANHEYSDLPGIRESVLDILLNLKEIVFKNISPVDKPMIGYLQARGPGVIYSSDLKLPKNIQCVDPNQYIATLNYDGNLNIKFMITEGSNYQIQNPRQIQQFTNENFHFLTQNVPMTLDPVFTPVQKVNYIIESDQLYPSLLKNDQPDEKMNTKNPLRDNNHVVILEIWTNGSIHPREALNQGIDQLFTLFASLSEMSLINNSISYSLQKSRTHLQRFISKVEKKTKF